MRLEKMEIRRRRRGQEMDGREIRVQGMEVVVNEKK